MYDLDRISSGSSSSNPIAVEFLRLGLLSHEIAGGRVAARLEAVGGGTGKSA